MSAAEPLPRLPANDVGFDPVRDRSTGYPTAYRKWSGPRAGTVVRFGKQEVRKSGARRGLAVSAESPLLFRSLYGVRANATHSKIVRDRPVIDGTFHRWWERSIEASGVRYRNPHMTRHTMATRWLRDGARLETLSVVLGHASIRTTFDLYGHLDMTDVALDMRLIEGRA